MSRMKKLLATLTVVAALSLNSVGTPAPAHAAASDCWNSGALACLWDGSNFGKPIHRILPNMNDRCGILDLRGWNNRTSSVWNNSVWKQWMWTHKRFTGARLTISKQSGVSSLSSRFNNNLESWKGRCSTL